jgi:cytochrome c556
MKKWLLGLAAAGLVLTNLGAADDKVPSVDEIMKMVNKKKGGLHTDVADLLKAGSIDWATVQDKTKKYAAMADFLGKNDPPQGDKSSWEKLTKAYSAEAKSLDAAAGKKDKAGATASMGKLQRSCMGCHKVHRPS